MSERSTGETIRRFFSDLFRSHHMKYIETELVRTRLHYESLMRDVKEEKARLEQKLWEMQTLLLPQMQRFSPEFQAKREAFQKAMASTAEMTGGMSWAQTLAEHNRALENLDKEEKNHGRVANSGS